MEVGPLSRMLVAYASGHARVKELVGAVLKTLNVGPEALFSTLGRVAARGIETQVLAEKLERLGRCARREHGLGRAAHSRQLEVGSRHLAG